MEPVLSMTLSSTDCCCWWNTVVWATAARSIRTDRSGVRTTAWTVSLLDDHIISIDARGVTVLLFIHVTIYNILTTLTYEWQEHG